MLQPTILTSTVDQFGSRVLFRGYGVTDRNLPIHAALTGNDTLVILDEAHCSRPFSQTMNAVSRFRDAGLPEDSQPKWSESYIRTPFVFAQMTATPDADASPDSIFNLIDTDYADDPLLQQRHSCAKPILLVHSKAKGKRQNADLAKSLAQQADVLADPVGNETPCRRIAIVVNRVACARATFECLRKKHGDRVHLMIGRMRPIDRDKLTAQLQATFRSDPDRANKEQLDEPNFVVATQCLEVGADFDFDGMVSQCASLDALRQRYGRLNRLGQASHSRGVIVMAAGDAKPKDPDPIYGTALPLTWKWLHANAAGSEDAKRIDFGIQAMDKLLSDETDAVSLCPGGVDAPVLLPAHLDLLSQTSPRPAVEPEIATFLHGPERGQAEVRVCWRADLPRTAHRFASLPQWAAAAREAIAVCPPTSAEVLSVPLAQFRRWLIGEATEDNSGDVLGERHVDDGSPSFDAPASRFGVLWTGQTERSALITADSARDIRPNDTIVLPVTTGGWDAFGHLPDAPSEPLPEDELTAGRMRELARVDVATSAFYQARNRTILRIHPALVRNSTDARVMSSLKKWIDSDSGGSAADVLNAEDADADNEEAPTEEPGNSHGASETESSLRALREHWSGTRVGTSKIQLIRYTGGLALIGPRENSQNVSRRKLPRASFGGDFDESNVDADDRLLLSDHLADVADETARLLNAIPPGDDVAAAVIEAARLHDIGKADPRFQAMLLHSTPDFACMQPALLAKSNRGLAPKQASGQRFSHSLPPGFRHEMLSVELATRVSNNLDDDQQQLMLHTIASHHGYARPFAPVVLDEAPPTVSLAKLNGTSNVVLTAEDRSSLTPAHRLDSGVAQRFWTMNRRFGWWGLSWLETAVRLSDWTASAQPRQASTSVDVVSTPLRSPSPTTTHQLPLPGIDGSNPLGFLAALGTLSVADSICADAQMRWDFVAGFPCPVLIGFSDSPADAAELVTRRLLELPMDTFEVNPRLPFDAADFAQFLSQVSQSPSRRAADFGAALGVEVVIDPKKKTFGDTAFRMVRSGDSVGNGFSNYAVRVRSGTSVDSIHRCLFAKWDYSDSPPEFRWDPVGEKPYALGWDDPAKSAAKTMLGANSLALESLPLFPTVCQSNRVSTTGFQRYGGTRFFSWPIWSIPLTLEVVRSLISEPTITDKKTDHRRLASMGVTSVFRSRRFASSQYYSNFAPAESV